MAEHNLKCWPGPFQSLEDGRKTFEFRRNDRGYSAGDTLVLEEWDNNRAAYTGRVSRWTVPYILHAGFGLPDGYCIMSVKRVSP